MAFYVVFGDLGGAKPVPQTLPSMAVVGAWKDAYSTARAARAAAKRNPPDAEWTIVEAASPEDAVNSVMNRGT
ncbi:MAG TPA: hypothetical protein VFZ12_02645 [Dehalococcoidia bacterium]|nr:hypothetical protein [Dehalococcoidia bacterium]